MALGAIVLLRGKLRGMGREAECDILARRVDESDPRYLCRSFRYLECSILTAPADLPDGDYMAYFAGHSMVATRTRGFWISTGAVARDAAAGGLEEGRVMDSAAAGPEAPANPPPIPDKGFAATDPMQTTQSRRGC